MADINIEKKNKPVWPWILGLLLFIGVVWLAVELVDTDPKPTAYTSDQVITTDQERITEEGLIDEQVGISMDGNKEETQESQGQSAEESSADKNAFVSYVEDTNIKQNLGKDHQVTGEALKKLSTALKDLSGGNASYEQSINKIQQNAEQIQQNPESMKHADMIKESFSTAANVMGQIQEQQYPEAAASEIQDVQKASDQVQVEEQLLNQQEEVNTFFEEAAQAIEEMENQSQKQDQQPS